MPPVSTLPDVVAHADWGSAPDKRWLVRAVREGGPYRALSPEPAGPLDTLLTRLQADTDPGACVFVGFDFPIGLPAAYARRAGVEDFLDVLARLGQGPWAEFFDIAERPDQVTRHRPFYPRRSGKKGEVRHQHLLDGLGFSSMQELLRTCERRTATRGDACVLFWTLGGNQVGRAAIIGWRDVLGPALRDGATSVSVWPFHGPLAALLAPGRVVVAETYPAEFYGHLGVAFRAGRAGGKRSQADRRASAAALLDRLAQLGVVLDPGLRAQIEDGFGPSPAGEDPFDAVVGLVGMLNVLLGGRPAGEPDEANVRSLEGWILGQASGQPSEKANPLSAAVGGPS